MYNHISLKSLIRRLKSINNRITYYCRLFIISFTALIIFAGCKPSWNIENPYEQVDWENHERYKANLHTHTTLSDGGMNPHEVVDLYQQHGYHILAITDHDHVTYPWTEFSQMKPVGRFKVRRQRRIDEGQIRPEELVYEDRNPNALGMIAIQGNEVTQNRPHNHMNTFFSSHGGSSRMEATLGATAEDNGLVIWNHPYMGGHRELISQLTDDPIGWYIEKYLRYDHLIGQEMNNNRHDHLIWDAVLGRIMPDRPVWGFSNDDFHTMRGFGRNWNVFVLPELSDEWVYRGMKEGRFFVVFSPDGPDGPDPPEIESINVDNQTGTIEIQASGYEFIEWISNGEVVFEGNPLRLNEIPEIGTYVRAILHGEGGTYIGTQPFGIRHPGSKTRETTETDPYLSISKGDIISDIDGNIYNTTIIGNQQWMTENLRTTHYRDGSPITFYDTDYTSWQFDQSGAYSWYDNDMNIFGEKYGALYNWYAVNNSAGLCPVGWRVPTDDEWKELELYLGMSYLDSNIAGPRGNISGNLMSTRSAPDEHPRWDNLPGVVSNNTEFSALPGGFTSTTGYSIGIGKSAYWWTSTERNTGFAWTRKLQYEYSDVTRLGFAKNLGFNVRCIRY